MRSTARRLRVVSFWWVVAILALLVAAPAARAGAPEPPHCPLLSKGRGLDHAIPGTSLVARDPYTGLLPRGGASFSFSVRGPKSALEGLARVEWTVDGVTDRVDDRGPRFSWVASPSQYFSVGGHTVKVTVVPKSGSPASVEFSLTATDCQYLRFVAFPPPAPGKGTTELTWDSAYESDQGPTLTVVAARADRNIVSALPDRVRGRKVGTLTIRRPGRARVQRTLRAPRHGSVLVSGGALRATLHPGAKEFLTVTGLPAGTQSVGVVLRGIGTRLVHSRNACRMALVRGVLWSGRAHGSDVSGGFYPCRPSSV